MKAIGFLKHGGPEVLLRRAQSLFSFSKVREGILSPHIFEKYPLARTSEAHRTLEKGITQGKILLMNELITN